MRHLITQNSVSQEEGACELAQEWMKAVAWLTMIHPLLSSGWKDPGSGLRRYVAVRYSQPRPKCSYQYHVLMEKPPHGSHSAAHVTHAWALLTRTSGCWSKRARPAFQTHWEVFQNRSNLSLIIIMISMGSLWLQEKSIFVGIDLLFSKWIYSTNIYLVPTILKET